MSIENRKFSKQVRAGIRTYFFDIESNKLDGRNFFNITESKQINNGFQRSEIKLYVDNVNDFVEALNEMIDFYNLNVKDIKKVTNKVDF